MGVFCLARKASEGCDRVRSSWAFTLHPGSGKWAPGGALLRVEMPGLKPSVRA